MLALVSLCAATMALADSAVAAATTAQKIERAARAGDISPAQKLIYGLRSYGNQDAVPRELRGDDNKVSRELSMLLLEARRARTGLTYRQRQEVDAYLARPSDVVGDGTGWCDDWTLYNTHSYDTADGKFRIHWVSTALLGGAPADDAPDLSDTGGNGIPQDVDGPTGVAAALATTYTTEVATLQWAPPLSDTAVDGNGRSDVYLCELKNNGVYGYVAPDPSPGRTTTSFMVVDNDFVDFPSSPADSRNVTVAHEYNHMIQYGYDYLQDRWMHESTATWMEELVYPAINDYVNYLPSWAAAPQNPLTQAGGGREYGSMVWNLWLSDAEGWGQEVVRSAWQKSQVNTVGGGGFAPAAYSDAIDDLSSGGSFSESFGRFAVALAEWTFESPPRFAEAPANYPDVPRSGTLAIGQTASLNVNHTAFNLVNVTVPASGAVRLRASSGDGSAPLASSLAALVGRRPSGQVVSQLSVIPSGGPATLTLTDAGQYSRVTAVIVNRDVAHNGWNGVDDWLWANDGIPYSLQVDGGNTPPVASFTLGGEAIVGTPLTFAAGSTDANVGDTLTHYWDLDNDGQFDDATGVTASYTYLLAGQQTARLRTVDEFGASAEYSIVFPVRATALAEDPSGTDQPPVVRANLARLPRVKRGRLRLKFSASEPVRLTGVIKYGRRQIAKASAKGDSTKKGIISFKLKKKYWKLLRKRKKLKVTVTLTALDSTNQKFSDKRKTLIKKG